MLRCAEPRANVHVFGPGATELPRQRICRDRLRGHPEDRRRYAEAKRAAAAAGGHGMEYNARKQQVLREILVRAIEASAPWPAASLLRSSRRVARTGVAKGRARRVSRGG